MAAAGLWSPGTVPIHSPHVYDWSPQTPIAASQGYRVSMKRRSPYGATSPEAFSHVPQRKVRVPDRPSLETIYARTHATLMAAAQTVEDSGSAMEAQRAEEEAMALREAAAQRPSAAGLIYGRCFLCYTDGEVLPCAFCEKASCASCMRQCEACQDMFCTFCSTPNYDLHKERSFCLDCNAAEAAALGAASAAQSGGEASNGGGDGGMEWQQTRYSTL